MRTILLLTCSNISQWRSPKSVQEVITHAVFTVFSMLYFHQELKWNYFVGFAMIVGAVFFIFTRW